jgi:two-component system, response regulator / RNA-binding antiterminator
MSDISSKTQLGEQNSIRILLIDESLPRAQLLQSALREAGVRDIVMFHRTDGLFDQVREVRPDVILIEVESPKRDTLEQLSLIREHNPMPVVMFTQDYESQSIQAAVSSGVCAYVVDGVNKQQVQSAINVAMATFEEFKGLRKEVQQARRELSQHKRIDRAKAILMNERGLSEDEAYRALRKLAMDRKRKLQDVADDVIAMSKLFDRS